MENSQKNNEHSLPSSANTFRKKTIYTFFKRVFDILFSVLSMILLSPIFLIIAIAIKVDDPKGSVIYVSERVGKNGRIFKFYKFRSMCTDADKIYNDIQHNNETGGPTFKMEDDPRVTKVG